MKITGALSDVLPSVKEKDFIAIGELHNTRSAIKFIIDNIDFLAPPNDGRKTYFLTEFLKPGDFLNNARFLKDADIRNHLKVRERYRGKPHSTYNLTKLYEVLLERNIEIISIEDGDTQTSSIFEGINQGNLEAIKARTEGPNNNAVKQAENRWRMTPKARILIFAGMSHIANSKCKKFKSDGEIAVKGITERLKEFGKQGVSIDIHDPILCKDEKHLTQLYSEATCFTKHAPSDSFVSIDNPDFLLFLKAQESEELNSLSRDQTYENIFMPGEWDGASIQDDAARHKALDEIIKTRHATQDTMKSQASLVESVASKTSPLHVGATTTSKNEVKEEVTMVNLPSTSNEERPSP